MRLTGTYCSVDRECVATALMNRFDLLESRADGKIATLMARENGKVLAQARHEVAVDGGEVHIAGIAIVILGRIFESGVGKLSDITT